MELILLFLVCSLANWASGSYTCTKAGNSGCDDCGNLVLCQGTTAPFTKFLIKCQSGQVCQSDTETAAGCYKYSDAKVTSCKCKTWPTYIPDPFDDSHYIVCLSSTSQISQKCPAGQIFSKATNKCAAVPTEPTTTTLPPPTCNKDGFFSNDPSCKTYYGCFPDENNVLKPTDIIECNPATDYFDERVSGCITEDDLQPKIFTCPDMNGGVIDSNECNMFHICSGSGDPLGTPICCDNGKIFDQQSMICVAATADNQSNCPQISKCLDPLAYNKTCQGEWTSPGDFSSSSTSSSTSPSTTVSTSSSTSPSTTVSTSSSTSTSTTVSTSSSTSPSTTVSTSSSTSPSTTVSTSSSTSPSTIVSASSTTTTITTDRTTSTSFPTSTTTQSTSTVSTTPNCSKDGAVAYPADCTKYYWCANGKYTLKFCPTNYLFDKTKGYCNLAASVSGC